MGSRTKSVRRAVAVCLAGLLVCWLLLTRFQPHRFRPFGSLWWEGGIGIGRIVDTGRDRKYRQWLRAGLRDGLKGERMRAIGSLADEPSPAELNAIIAALVADPEEGVRGAAALALGLTPRVPDDSLTAKRIVRVLAVAVAGDPSPTVRDVAAQVLEWSLWPRSGTDSEALRLELMAVARPYVLPSAGETDSVFLRALEEILTEQADAGSAATPEDE